MAGQWVDVDAGAGETGPWLSWHAAATRDGAHPPGSWTVRDAAGRAAVNLTPGFVIDWLQAKTGWISGGGVAGVAPQKKWNKSVAKMEPQPGEEWKKAMAMPVAYMAGGQPSYALWEQNSFAAFAGFVDLMALIRDTAQASLPNLPLVGYAGHRTIKLGNGNTLVPQFKLIRYVPRPTCLPEESALAPQAETATDAWGGAPQATPAARPQPKANGAAPGAMMMAGNHPVPLPTSEVSPGPGSLIEDDDIPF